MKSNCCRWTLLAWLLVMPLGGFMGCKSWSPMGRGESASKDSSIYDDPSYDLPASAGSRTTTSARPGGLSKEARAIEARLGIQ